MPRTKTRFDALDVAAEVRYLQSVALGRRVINIYNSSSNNETYIFKLDKGTGGGAGTTAVTNDSNKNNDSGNNNLLLLLESGVRFHTHHQDEQATNPAMPSQFCTKLRKHLRGLRLESITQLGQLDRVVHLVFGSGTSRHSLMLELYAKGNIVLTDSSYKILTLLRSHEYKQQQQSDQEQQPHQPNDGRVQVRVGHAYPVTYATTMTISSTDTVDDHPDQTDAGESTANTNKANTLTPSTFLNSSDPMKWYQDNHKEGELDASNPSNNKKKKKKGNDSNSHSAWKQFLLNSNDSGVSHYGPSLIEHCLIVAGLWSNDAKFPSQLDSDEWTNLQTILQTEGQRLLDVICQDCGKGYILYQEKNHKMESEDGVATPVGPFDDKILLEFQPHVLLKQHEDMPRLEYDTFDGAVDVFFSHLESQKRMLRAEQQEHQAKQRLEKIKLDQEKRVENLLVQQQKLQEEARLVEIHADVVEKAIQVVNSALDSGMDWDQLEDLVELEKTQNRNPVAMIIHKLDLEHDQMVLELLKEEEMYEQYEEQNTDTEDDMKNGSKSNRFMYVPVNLTKTAHGNAEDLFAKYRASKEKGQKTIEASAKALEAAEETAKRQMLDAQRKRSDMSSVQTKRKPLWFERFNWFITSDNYLVLGGRDAQQNEQLVKRYLRPGDAYLHADVHGAASCILRAKRRRDPNGKTSPLPLSSQALREAGNFTICRSSAWTSRMVTSAWWVESHQVSKTAPSGEYLTVGSFMVRGKKNFLPPSALEMGLAVLFRLGDDDSVLRHKNERRDFALMQFEEEGEVAIDDFGGNANEVASNGRVESEIPSRNESNVGSLTSSTVGKDSEEESSTTEILKSDRKLEEGANEEAESSDKEISADEPNSQPNSAHPTTQEPPNQKKKKGLSVKERKLIKKYGSLEAAKAAEEERLRNEEQVSASSESASVSASAAASTKPQSTHKRGKKAKMKRMAKKYADQDEEDRELALLALHAGEKEKKTDKKKVPQINEKEKEAAAETLAILKKDSAAIADRLPEEVRKVLGSCVAVQDGNEAVVRWDKFDGDVLEQLLSFDLEIQMVAAANRLSTLKQSSRIDNFSASLAGIIRTIRKYGHEKLNQEATPASGGDVKRKKKSEKVAEQESWKKTLAEEGLVDADLDDTEDTVDDTAELNRLTGKPQKEDLVLHAIPVCAPYQTLSQYTYRVKLTPGNMKRGKASKQCVDMFAKESKKGTEFDRYKDLIKKVSDNDWVQAICGDVKISAAGASKAIQKAKANKAKNKKKK